MNARLYRDDAGEWRWTLAADNGEPLAVSSEGYRHRGDAEHALHLVTQAGPDLDLSIESAPES